MPSNHHIHVTVTNPAQITPEIITHGADAESITVTNTTTPDGTESITITVAGPRNHQDLAEALERYAQIVRELDD